GCDASGRERMDALAQPFHDVHDLPAVAANEFRDEFMLEQSRDRCAARPDRVTESHTAATRMICDVDDRQFERVELLDRVTARRIHGNSDESRLSGDDGGA